MIIRWLQNVFKERKEVDSTGSEEPKELIDLAHRVLSQEAKEREALLHGLEHFGPRWMKQKESKRKIKDKIKSSLKLPLSPNEEEDIAEEITERIAEIAEVDPFVNHLFLDSEKTKG